MRLKGIDEAATKMLRRKSVAFFGNLNLEKLALICWFCVKCIFLLCKTVIYIYMLLIHRPQDGEIDYTLQPQ